MHERTDVDLGAEEELEIPFVSEMGRLESIIADEFDEGWGGRMVGRFEVYSKLADSFFCR